MNIKVFLFLATIFMFVIQMISAGSGFSTQKGEEIELEELAPEDEKFVVSIFYDGSFYTF